MKQKNIHKYLPAASVFLFGLLLSFAITFQTFNLSQQQTRSSVQSIANSRINIFKQLLDQRVAVSNTMEAIVMDDQGKIQNIDAITREIYRTYSPNIITIALAPEGKTSFIYPEQKIEKSDLFEGADKDEFIYSRNTQRVMIHVYNDNRLVIYNPVYLREEATGYDIFWGFVILVCPFDTIADEARITELGETSYNYRLVMDSSYNRSSTVLSESSSNWNSLNAESYTVEEPGFKFTLSISPEKGWYDAGQTAFSAVTCITVTILVTMLTVSFTRQRQNNELLSRLSSHDSLTHLPNRRSFYTTLDLLIREHKEYTIFFMDANHFKEVNDTYGHEAGNEVLCEYGIRLNEVFPDHVYRLGGDEFASIVSKKLTDPQAEETMKKIDHALSRQYTCNEAVIPLSISSGWAVSDPEKSIDSVLNEADKMMYQNKQKYHAQKKSE